jgi:hypothetical protein
MQTWSSLSVQQRNQARLNFFTSRQLSPEDCKPSGMPTRL